MRMLIVEDDADLAEMLALGFRDEGFAVDTVADGVSGLHEASTTDYDVVILDLMLPELDGFGIVDGLRGAGRSVPVMFLSARDEVENRVRGLQLGADDYLTKPFSFEELLARVHALVRRSHGIAENRARWGDLVLDLDARTVSWRDRAIELTPMEYSLLELLVLGSGRVLSRTELIERIYDHSFDCDSNVIDVHVGHLRRKLRSVMGSCPIETKRGVGFIIPREESP